MNHKPKGKPTNAELEILNVLWEGGPATVREVNDHLNTQKEVGYTTTLKLMQIMLDKGLLLRKKAGRTHIYRATITQEEARQDLVDRLLDSVFQGSAMKLVMQALGSRKVNKEELGEIRDLLDQLDHEKKGGKL